MNTPKPDWLSYLVDVAQIVSAIATACAVIAALWIARRSESQRLRMSISYRDVITMYTLTPEHSKEFYASMTIVNVGILPVIVEQVYFKIQMKATRHIQSVNRNQRGEERAFPARLQHGEAITFDIQVRPRDFPWTGLHPNWYFWNRPSFHVFTTLGEACSAKAGFKMLLPMKTFIDEMRRLG